MWSFKNTMILVISFKSDLKLMLYLFVVVAMESDPKCGWVSRIFFA